MRPPAGWNQRKQGSGAPKDAFSVGDGKQIQWDNNSSSKKGKARSKFRSRSKGKKGAQTTNGSSVVTKEEPVTVKIQSVAVDEQPSVSSSSNQGFPTHSAWIESRTVSRKSLEFPYSIPPSAMVYYTFLMIASCVSIVQWLVWRFLAFHEEISLILALIFRRILFRGVRIVRVYLDSHSKSFAIRSIEIRQLKAKVQEVTSRVSGRSTMLRLRCVGSVFPFPSMYILHHYLKSLPEATS